ncbi:MAG: ROK family protein [Lacibacter sp.]
MKKEELIIGADIGGSHITAGIVDINKMEVIKSTVVRNKLDSNGSAEEIFEVWIKTLKGLIETNAVERIGFAMPGPFDYEKGICLIKGLSKYESLYEIDVRAVLSEKLRLKPGNILFRNDAEAFLAGELSGGAAKGFHHSIGITLGTGLGTAVSHNGHVENVEKGSMIYKDEIIEEFVSTRGLQRQFHHLAGRSINGVKELSEIYDKHDAAKMTFDFFGEHLTWFLNHFIETESPEVLVVGGNIAHAWNMFMPSVIAKLEKQFIKMPVVVKAELGEDAALIGGACCFDLSLISAKNRSTGIESNIQKF